MKDVDKIPRLLKKKNDINKALTKIKIKRHKKLCAKIKEGKVCDITIKQKELNIILTNCLIESSDLVYDSVIVILSSAKEDNKTNQPLHMTSRVEFSLLEILEIR